LAAIAASTRVRHGVDELRELITDAWRLKAPKRVRAAFEVGEASEPDSGG
jgi:hypothetical protein